MKHHSFAKATFSSVVFGALLISSYALANVEKDGYGILHQFPRMTDNYTAANPVPFSDGTLWAARRVTPLQTPENITVHSSDGYDTTTVTLITTAHSWSGVDITDWNDTSDLSGNAAVSAGNHGYWTKITEKDTTPLTDEVTWLNTLNGTTAYRSGGFTVNP
jgi:hypothetical protein